MSMGQSVAHDRGSARPLGALAVAAISLITATLISSLISVIVDGVALADFERTWDQMAATGQWPRGSELEWQSRAWLRNLTLVLQFAGAVVFLSWLWRARRNAERLFARRHRLSIGWVIGAWVCPIVNLWFPRTIMIDVVRAADPRSPNKKQRGPGNGLVNAWWSAMLLSWLLTFVAMVLRLPVIRTESTDDSIAFGVAPLGGSGLIVVETIAIGVLACAAVLLGAIMLRVQRGQEIRATNQPESDLSGNPRTAPIGTTTAPHQPRTAAATIAVAPCPAPLPEPAAPAEPPTLPLRDSDPTAIGRFTLIGRLESTGLGDSYLGRDENTGLVVVRTVHPDRMDRGELARTFTAARTLRGAHIPAVLDADADAERPWITTEYVPGPTLRELVAARGPLPSPMVEALTVDLAHALSALRAGGLTHGGLTPDSVIPADAGPRIIGVGSPAPPPSAFSAPEQFTDDSSGPASDIFSLGGVLVYALTGRTPFGDSGGANLLHRMTTQLPDLTGIPESKLRTVLLGCLTVHPDARLTTGQIVGQLATTPSTTSAPGGVAAVPRPNTPAPAAVVTSLPTPAPRVVATQRRTVLAAGVVAGLGLAGAGAFAATRLWDDPAADAVAIEAVPGRVRWKSGPNSYGDLAAIPPAAHGGRLFVANSNTLSALEASTGRSVWQAPLGALDIKSGPMLSGDTVIVGGSKLVAGFDAATGALLWQGAGSASFAMATTHQPAYVYAEEAVGRESAVIALDARTGHQRWRYAQRGTTFGFFGADGDTVAVVDGTAFALLDAATGVPKGRIEVGHDALAQVGVVGATVVVQSPIAPNLRVFDLVTGQQLWSSRSAAAFGAAVGDNVYIGGGRNNYGGGGPAPAPLSAHDIRTRRTLWTREPQQIIGAPAVANGTIYAVWGSELYALDATTGSTRWNTIGLRATSSPVVIDKTAYLYSRGGVTAVEL